MAKNTPNSPLFAQHSRHLMQRFFVIGQHILMSMKILIAQNIDMIGQIEFLCAYFLIFYWVFFINIFTKNIFYERIEQKRIKKITYLLCMLQYLSN